MRKKYLILYIFFITFFSCKELDSNGYNFLIVFVDDMGYGDIGVYGHPTIKTPYLDKI